MSQLITQINAIGTHPKAPPTGSASTPVGGELTHATLRLLQALTSARDVPILGSAIVREICYRVLTGEQGGAMVRCAPR